MSKLSAPIALAVGMVVIGIGYHQPRAIGLHERSLTTTAQAPSVNEPGGRGAAGASRRELLDKYCVRCHNARLKTAGLELDAIDAQTIDAASTAVWEKVARRIRTGSMPPPSVPRPVAAASDAFVSSLEASLDRLAEARPDPGSATIRRLNRAEYVNAIRDLLVIDVDGAALLPSDNSDLGFDNMAGSLSLSPALLERYMSAAHNISRLALGDVTQRPATEHYYVPKMLFQDDRMSDDLPFGSRGGTSLRHYFPLDAEYTIKIALRKSNTDYIIGLEEPQDLEVRLDGQLLKRFRIGGEKRGRPTPLSYAGNILGDVEWESYMHTADASLELRVPVKAGSRIVGVSFVERPEELEGVLQPPMSGASFAIDAASSSTSGRMEAAVDSVTITAPDNATGPGDTPSRQRLLVCRPTRAAQEERCASKIFVAMARRAYRRPVTAEDLSPLLTFYREGRKQGTFEAGVQRGLERILVDPNFLFRAERDPSSATPGSVHPVSDVELASRLSFFIWSSVPDDELLDLAVRGKLKDPVVLEQQARRLLADERSRALVDNFAGQWLYLRNVRTAAPDPDLFFRDFDDNLRQAFETETNLFITSQLREDRSVLDLLRANYTFVNERLARHYQIPNVIGEAFRRVPFDDGTRGGLLGQGSILTVTSYANRTSPVLRGRWLLENVLGTPPPPPPPNVPALKDTDPLGNTLSMRERMEQHRKNPACASCHARMDPLGFALENFDAIGRWRTVNEAGMPIDASGTLPDGTGFNGVAGLRAFLSNHSEQFASTVTEKLLMYALGRGVEPNDMPPIRKILREAAPGEWRWSSLILGIAKSVPFQMKKFQETS